AKFRRLKKLAFEAQDQTREQEFFAQELRCRRFWYDRPFGRGVARFWLGWFYGGVANFGRSLLRPVTLWLLMIILCSGYYLGQRPGPNSGQPWSAAATTVPAPAQANVAQRIFGNVFPAESAPCVSGNSNPVGEALYLSLRNAILKLDWDDAGT